MDIGEGLFIEHGFATAIGAKSIGKNCYINQQVTIAGEVTIMDNVRIHSGAIVIGKIVIGSNSVIGANTTVLRDIPSNATVFPPTPRIMNWRGDDAKMSTEEENLQME